MLQFFASLLALFAHPGDVGGIILTAPPAQVAPATSASSRRTALDVGGIILASPTGNQKAHSSDVGGVILVQPSQPKTVKSNDVGGIIL